MQLPAVSLGRPLLKTASTVYYVFVQRTAAWSVPQARSVLADEAPADNTKADSSGLDGGGRPVQSQPLSAAAATPRFAAEAEPVGSAGKAVPSKLEQSAAAADKGTEASASETTTTGMRKGGAPLSWLQWLNPLRWLLRSKRAAQVRREKSPFCLLCSLLRLGLTFEKQRQTSLICMICGGPCGASEERCVD